jgi:hypothetical protein
MVVPIRCSPVVGASPEAAEEPVCDASMAGTARSAAEKTLVGEVRQSGSGGGLDSGERWWSRFRRAAYRIPVSFGFVWPPSQERN